MTTNIKLLYYFIGHLFLLALLYCLLYIFGLIHIIPQENNLVQWDSGWYQSIVEQGYLFNENEQSNTGFFPLFPLIWKFTKLSNIGISILNLILFLIGIFLVFKSVKQLKPIVVLLSLSFPSLFFMYVPYSEAIFFLSASLYLYGNSVSKDSIKIIALLVASLARPTIFFFLPAVIFSEVLANDKMPFKVKKSILYVTAIVIGTLISFYIVGYNSGNFFAYSDSQIQNWSHNFSIPSLPLTTWRGYRILWLDFLGLWVVILSFILSLKYFLKALKNKFVVTEHKNLLLSVSYFSMVFIYILFFHPKEETTGLTSILSLNRYVFCAPFVFYLFYIFYQKTNITAYKWGIISLALSVVLIGFPYKAVAELSYLKTLLFIPLIIGFLGLQFVPKLFKTKLVYFLVYLVNSGVQVYLFQSFLKGNWIG